MDEQAKRVRGDCPVVKGLDMCVLLANHRGEHIDLYGMFWS